METEVASATTEMDATINEIARTAGNGPHRGGRRAPSALDAADGGPAAQLGPHRRRGAHHQSRSPTRPTSTKAPTSRRNMPATAVGASPWSPTRVKELARGIRTGDTNSIGSVVAGTGDDVASAVAAMEHIRTIIGDVEEASTVIAAAVEEQTAAMREIVGQVEMAAQRGVQIREAVRDARSVGAA
ncbi:MAG: hypothetical protein R2749_18980 [Acidimicrobiales bacterium]